jgi:hypothetical protein
MHKEGVGKKMDNQPPAKASRPAFLDAPRCGAKTRKGTPCKAPAMANGRCRMHGGPSPGAPKGNRNAWKHGFYSAEFRAKQKLARELIRLIKPFIEKVHVG